MGEALSGGFEAFQRDPCPCYPNARRAAGPPPFAPEPDGWLAGRYAAGREVLIPLVPDEPVAMAATLIHRSPDVLPVTG